MTTKPNRRMPLSADSLAKCDVDLEQDLRRRATMVMSHGVKSLDGLDIDHDTAGNQPCWYQYPCGRDELHGRSPSVW